MENKEEYEQLVKEREELSARIKEVSGKIFQSQTKELFDKFPKLESFSFTQYTDYFNDGDTCYFHVHAWDPEINEYDFEEEPPELTDEETETISDEVTGVIDSLNEDDLLKMFGDH